MSFEGIHFNVCPLGFAAGGGGGGGRAGPLNVQQTP